MKNKICELLNIDYPIFQGGMAWIADASLAAAVSNAGGLGIIAAGNAPGDVVRAEITACKKLVGDKPFGVNIMLLSPFADEVAAVVMEEGVKVVTTGAGNPGKYMEDFKARGIKVIPVVPSVAIAKRMEKTGADAVIAEGMESGGHIGKLTTMAMLPQIVDAVSIPVIGAGGIGDGRGMAAAFMLGADGVQIGTRFLTADECTVHENFKNAIIKARDIDTGITGNITGHPVRALKNKLSKQYDQLEKEELAKETPDIAKIEALGTGTLRAAAKDGDVAYGSVLAGQIAGLVNKRQPAKEIIDELMQGFRETVAEINNGINE
ncbi:MAG: enoyl-[acyl-carrier-protein] reductase FabK [Clostridiales bacterium]|jgi:enoyl-[acyl-carrier protein] reductase II|nr:enoyl-[acyl-carrier-protein] reductase FabK [Clostridiales bacterium]